MGKGVGFYGGKFIIPHIGHVYSIIYASSLVDKLYVLLMYDGKEKGLDYSNVGGYISKEQRLRWLKQITKDMPNVEVGIIESTKSFSEEDANKVINCIGKFNYVFSSEILYSNYFKELYPFAEHIIIDKLRINYNISGSQLRKDGVYKHWEYIPLEVRPYFVKKVAILGTESSGKSTLTHHLAKMYNTNYIKEYGRTYYDNLGGYETNIKDFPLIAYQHVLEINKGLNNANKVLFIDTDAIITQNLCEAYEGKSLTVLDEIIKLQEIDLYLVLKPDVDWVDDGTRIFGEDSERIRQYNSLIGKLNKFNIRYIEIEGDYLDRIYKSKKEVDKLFDE